VLPVGNAGNISAYWLGYGEYRAAGLSSGVPRMWGFQAAGAAPLVSGQVVPEPETVATAIRVGNPASWHLALAARDESGGKVESVTDEQILSAQRSLASRDGVFVEPASAAGAAGLVQAHDRGALARGMRIVVTVTGHGLKDTATALSGVGTLVDEVVDAEVHAAAAAAGLG
jgi:threonine synthase